LTGYEPNRFCRICSQSDEIRELLDKRIAGGSTLSDVVSYAQQLGIDLNLMNVSRHKQHSTSFSPSISDPIDVSGVPDPALAELIYDQIKTLTEKGKSSVLTSDENQLLLNWTKTLLDMKKANLPDKRGETPIDYQSLATALWNGEPLVDDQEVDEFGVLKRVHIVFQGEGCWFKIEQPIPSKLSN